MNTHDKIKLPPLPEWADTTLQGEDRDSLFTWAEAAIKAALQSQDREDTERLDWLEEQAHASRTGISIDYVYVADDGYVNEKGFRFMRYRFVGPVGKSARAVIDHARRIEGDGE